MKLAEAVSEAALQPTNFKFLYDLNVSVLLCVGPSKLGNSGEGEAALIIIIISGKIIKLSRIIKLK